MAIKEYTLNDLCLIKNNLRTPINQNSRNKMKKIYPYYGANGIIDYVDFYKIDFSCILVAEDGSVINTNGILNIQYIENKKISVSNHAHIIVSFSNKIKLKYLYYSLLKFNAKKFISGSVQQKLSLKNLLKINLFIPDLQTQQEIINIIEPFEKLKESLITKIQELNKIFINFKDENIEQKIHLKNISSIRTGNKNANFASNNGTYRFFTCSLNKIQYCNSFEYNDEVILLAGNGDIGEIQYFNGKFDAYQRTYIIQTNLIGNVYYSLLRNKNFFKNNSKGSVVKFLTLSTIQNIKINLDEDKNDIRYKVIRLIFGYEQILLILNEVIKQLIELYLI